MAKQIFDEIMEGLGALKAERETGKTTLRRHRLPVVEVPPILPEEIKETREHYQLSQADLAALLGLTTSSLQRWEQGRGAPIPAARVLLRLAREYPDTIQRIQSLLPARVERPVTPPKWRSPTMKTPERKKVAAKRGVRRKTG